MDFRKVLPILIGEFKKENIRYAVMGGFSLGLMGIVRSTVDIDFLVNADDLQKLEKVMKKYGYRCFYKTENVSQYISEVKIFGEIDFLHAFRKRSLSMLERAQEKTVFEGGCKIKVLKPEDVIGLKLQALENDPSREVREYLDIERILEHMGRGLNWGLLEEYFLLFNKKDKFKRYKAKYGNS